jgi:hypothetical protein
MQIYLKLRSKIKRRQFCSCIYLRFLNLMDLSLYRPFCIPHVYSLVAVMKTKRV